MRDLPELDLAARPAARRTWGDLRQRAVSAALLVPLALACIWLGAAAWTVLIALGVAGLATEWVQLCGARVLGWPGLAVPLAVLAGAAASVGQAGLGLVLLGLGWLTTWGLAARHRRATLLAAGVLYIGLAGVALIWLRQDGGAGRANVLFLLPLVWASDVGAYAAGRLLGGPRLAPRISPSKTWAGAGGGLLAATATGLLLALLLGGEATSRAALVAGGLGLVAQAGDLLESGLKRRCGVKDSGRLIPGHGGLLDRLDGVLTAAPAAAALALCLGRGMPLWR